MPTFAKFDGLTFANCYILVTRKCDICDFGPSSPKTPAAMAHVEDVAKGVCFCLIR